MVLSPKDPFNWAYVFQQRGVRDTLKRTLKGHTEGTIQISACIIFRVVEDIVKGPRSKESKKGAVALFKSCIQKEWLVMLKQKISSKDHHSRQDSVRLAR